MNLVPIRATSIRQVFVAKKAALFSEFLNNLK